MGFSSSSSFPGLGFYYKISERVWDGMRQVLFAAGSSVLMRCDAMGPDDVWRL